MGAAGLERACVRDRKRMAGWWTALENYQWRILPKLLRRNGMVLVDAAGRAVGASDVAATAES